MPRVRSVMRPYSTRYYVLIVLVVTALLLAALPLRYDLGLAAEFWIGWVPSTLLTGILFLLIEMRIVLFRRLRVADEGEAQRHSALQRDPLTGALMRRAFMNDMRVATKATMPDQSSVLLLIDLDHFKLLNDTYGHHAGDFALQHLVEVASRSFPDAIVGRLGGDEFAVFLQTEGEGGWQRRADAFLEALRHPAQLASQQIVIGASIGIAAMPLHTAYHEELPLLADLALYRSKQRGRGQATVFDMEMLKDQRQRRNIERDLRAAILLNELDLHYQPIRKGDGTVEGVEALVRWQHPLRGMIAPDTFVPVAEGSHLIHLLGDWVICRACQDFHRLPGDFVSVNVSAVQFGRDEIVNTVLAALEKAKIAPTNLVLEITEGLALSTKPGVITRIEALRKAGVRFALDDFGTGNSGFNYLRDLPVDIVKIDRSYVSRLESDPVSRLFVTAVIETSRILGLAVIAEGIETETESVLTSKAGCTLFQGYLLGRPEALAGQVLMPAERELERQTPDTFKTLRTAASAVCIA